MIVLTFDNLGDAADRQRGARPAAAHPSLRVLPRLLELLAALELRATFFVEAVNTREHSGAVRAIAAGGHEIGLHGWRHERWDELEPAREREILSRGLAAFAELGIEVNGFRPPGGGLTADSLRLLREAGIEWCSPEGGEPRREAGVAIVPFHWPLVDATYLHPPVRRRLGLPETPLPPADAERQLRDALPGTLILHPFLAADEAVWEVHERLLRRLEGAVPVGVAAGAL